MIYIIIALAVLLCFMICNAIKMKPEDISQYERKTDYDFNKERAVERFRHMLQKKTVWPRDSEPDYEEFRAFLPMLKKDYPEVFKVMEVNVINDYGILLKWKGTGNKKPVVLMAHYDVVAVDEKGWDHPPFGAEIADGSIYARGTADTKCIIAGLLALLVAAGSIIAAFWFGSASSADTEALAKQAEEYLGYDDLEVMLTDQREDYFAALCRSPEDAWVLCVYDRDRLFRDRWVASGGKKRLKPGALASWNYGNPQGDAVLIFCGYGLSEDILFYTFSNAGVEYTLPVNGSMLLDIVIIPDNGYNINGYPIPLDENYEPIP